MPIHSIISQPPPSLRSAYVPHLITVRGFDFATSHNSVVYFDVYINGVYYKTITSTTPTNFLFHKRWTVDIKDALQEYLTSRPPQPLDFAGAGMAVRDFGTIAEYFVRVRGNTIANGVATPDGPVPVQATVGNGAQSGGGTQTLPWTAVNVPLQHEDDQRLNVHLATIPHYTHPGLLTFLYPLTKRQELHLTAEDYGFFPMIADLSPYLGDPTGQLHLRFVTDQGVEYQPSGGPFYNFFEKSVYYLPIGPRNLRGYAWAIGGAPQSGATITALFQSMPWYKVRLYQNDSSPLGQLVYETPRIYLKKCLGDYKRVHFVNACGHYEAVNFGDWEETSIVASSTWEKPLAGVATMGNKSSGGVQRFNVRSNERTTLLGWFEEKDLPMLKELQTTPQAYLEFKSTTQGGPAADYLPIHILDTEITTRKLEQRYVYEVALQYDMGHSNIHLRN